MGLICRLSEYGSSSTPRRGRSSRPPSVPYRASRSSSGVSLSSVRAIFGWGPPSGAYHSPADLDHIIAILDAVTDALQARRNAIAADGT